MDEMMIESATGGGQGLGRGDGGLLGPGVVRGGEMIGTSAMSAESVGIGVVRRDGMSGGEIAMRTWIVIVEGEA